MQSRYKKWAAYQKAFDLSCQIFEVSRSFPKEERYSLTDQVRRSSRSVCANMAESYARRSYAKHFKAKVTDCAAENFETQTWLDFALQAEYISTITHRTLTDQSETVGKLLSYMIKNPAQYGVTP